MDFETKKDSLIQLGEFFRGSTERYSKMETSTNVLSDLQKEMAGLIERVHHENGWFTKGSVLKAINAWASSLEGENVEKWLSGYDLSQERKKKVGVIMAGNIPLVGLHDALSVLISGNILHAKVSSKDNRLMLLVLQVLKRLSKDWDNRIIIAERLKDIDILLATGSDNSARYFEYYFKDKKKIIRKNRTSIAVLDGNETAEDLEGLSHDIFAHFGLGCRNVTKLYLPESYNLDNVFEALFPYKEIINHNKYANNYDYNKAVYLLNKVELIENGFLLLKEDEGLHSPVGVLFYEYYSSINEVKKSVDESLDSIQCVVTNLPLKRRVDFGKAQSPELWDYADGVDTLKFLLES